MLRCPFIGEPYLPEQCHGKVAGEERGPKDVLLILISDKPRLVQEAELSKVFVGTRESARYGMFQTDVLCASQSRHLFF